jgi:hypothetical protein
MTQQTFNRRKLITLGTSALMGLAAAPALATPSQREPVRLETCLFNFKDSVSAQDVAGAIATVKAVCTSAGGGFLIGRNFIPTPFPARFEWICMAQFDDFSAKQSRAAYAGFQQVKDRLLDLCRNRVDCALDVALPPQYADARGVGVRHTVMFNFKADASADARERNVAAIRRMGTLPMVQNYIVERNKSYVPETATMEWQVIGDFASVEDYKAYSQAPIHLAIRDDFTAQTSRVAFLDTRV